MSMYQDSTEFLNSRNIAGIQLGVALIGHLTKEMRKLLVFERRILRKIFGPICDNGKWRIHYNSELYSIYTDPDIIKTIKISKLRWTGHIN